MLKAKIQKMTYIKKLQKPLRKIIGKVQAKLLFELIKKIQKQYKTMMVGLGKKRKNSREKLVFTN